MGNLATEKLWRTAIEADHSSALLDLLQRDLSGTDDILQQKAAALLSNLAGVKTICQQVTTCDTITDNTMMLHTETLLPTVIGDSDQASSALLAQRKRCDPKSH